MKKTKLEKGITLIALIITIVLLLIIAVVTIGSIQNSKIIDHAQNASSKYILEQEKEQIGLASSEWQIEKYTGEKSFKEVVKDSLEGVATVEENVDGSLTITMDKTGNQYTLTNAGEIIPATKGISISPTSIIINEGEKEKLTVTLLGGLSGDITYSSSDQNVATVDSKGEVTGVALGTATITVTCGEYSTTCKVGVSNIEEYFFGNDEKVGRPLSDIANFIGTGVGIELKNEKLPNFQGDVTDINVLKITQLANWGYMYFEYQGVYYKARTNMTSNEVDGVPGGNTDENYGMRIIDPQGERVGDTVKFDGKLWTIIYDDNINGLQMVSNDSLNYSNGTYPFDLGYFDGLLPMQNNEDMSNWNKVKEEADLDENETLTKFERAVYSYNNAIETLNIACDNLVSENSNILAVRCVGSNPNPNQINAENATPYPSTKLENWPTNDSEHSAGVVKGVAKSADTNYEFDYDRMAVLGVVDGSYWMASRMVYETTDSIQFHVLRTDSGSFKNRFDSNESSICAITQSSAEEYIHESKLRPVVILKPDANLVAASTDGIDYILQ